MNNTPDSLAALKPCPFCGNDEPSFERMGTPRQSCIVVCGNCGCRHESSDEGARSGTQWNTRADALERQEVPFKVPTPPPMADVVDLAYAEGWNACCDAFFGGKPAPDPMVITVSTERQAAPDIRERIAEAHDASLDDGHRACRSILTECLRMLASSPSAPAQPEPQGCDCKSPSACATWMKCLAAPSAPAQSEVAEPVAWMYVYAKQGGRGVRFTERRAEAPEGGWKDYVETPLYATPPQPSPVADEREAFEAWWGQFAAEHDDWRFADSDALRWQAWQARAALASQPTAQGEPKGDRLQAVRDFIQADGEVARNGGHHIGRKA